MKKYSLRALLSGGILIAASSLLFAWGVWGHQHINHAAVFALPDSMRIFFFNHLDFITEEAAIPDIRKHVINDRNEPDRHYIDLEAYGDHPFDSLPLTWDAAEKKYGAKTLHKYGILPWYVQLMEEKLTQAFKRKRADEILFLAADLGHYIGDATVPLHTSVNHDGQLTNQKGIHAFWESQLPELFGGKYNFHVARAHYIKDIDSEIWKVLRESHSQVDSVLGIEKRLEENFPANKIYKTNSKGIAVSMYGSKVHSDEFTKAYNTALHGMVEKQMRFAIQEIADFWYTAWRNAGSPNLIDLDPKAVTKQNKKLLQKEYRLWKKGKLWGFQSTDEF